MGTLPPSLTSQSISPVGVLPTPDASAWSPVVPVLLLLGICTPLVLTQVPPPYCRAELGPLQGTEEVLSALSPQMEPGVPRLGLGEMQTLKGAWLHTQPAALWTSWLSCCVSAKPG